MLQEGQDGSAPTSGVYRTCRGFGIIIMGETCDAFDSTTAS